MANDVLDQQIRDTTVHESGAMLLDGDVTFQFANGLNQSVDYTVEGTYDADDNFADAVQVATGTVNSGSTASATVTAPWEQARVTATCATAPTAGSLLVKGHE